MPRGRFTENLGIRFTQTKKKKGGGGLAGPPTIYSLMGRWEGVSSDLKKGEEETGGRPIVKPLAIMET